MSDRTFDSLTRRASLAVLGAAGLAALAGTAPAVAGKRTRRKRRKRKKSQKGCEDRCVQQVDQCEVAIAETCELGQAACARQVECCAFFETCDFASFLSCAIEA